MGYAFKYDLTEEEKRAVRTMLASGLARHGVSCVVSAEELLDGLGAGPEGLHCLPDLASRLGALVVTEIRNGLALRFAIFKNLEPIEAPQEKPSWRFRFTRKFLQFCIGRTL